MLHRRARLRTVGLGAMRHGAGGIQGGFWEEMTKSQAFKEKLRLTGKKKERTFRIN